VENSESQPTVKINLRRKLFEETKFCLGPELVHRLKQTSAVIKILRCARK